MKKGISRSQRVLRVSWAASVLGVLTAGCSSTHNNEPQRPSVPEIARQAAPAERGPESEPADVVTAEAASDEPPAVPVEGMVGQIAGRPIYAHHVLEDLNDQLAGLGRSLPASTFRQRAMELILKQVNALILDAVLLDQAERSLDDRQRLGVENLVASQRENFLRLYGQGSLALTERRILEDTGLTLQENLRVVRTRFLVGRYLNRNVDALVNVTRRDIERYYHYNHEIFNPPAQRELNLIYSQSPSDTQWFLSQLEAGVPFAELALDDRNAYRGKATPFAAELSEGDTMFGPNIDPAVLELAQGEWVGPLPNRGQEWFVYVDKLEQPEQRSLFDAQVDIEAALRGRDKQDRQQQLFAKLRREASFTDEQQMTEAVLAIAVARYAAP